MSDVHSETAARWYNIPVEDVTSEQRKVGKVLNYSEMYQVDDVGWSNRLKYYYEAFPVSGIRRDLIFPYFGKLLDALSD